MQRSKRILQDTYGKDVEVHKALIKELGNLPNVSNIHKPRDIHEFHSEFSCVVRYAESNSYNQMDKVGPVREVIAQKDDKWESWGSEEIAEDLRKLVERNPAQVQKVAFIGKEPQTQTGIGEVKTN